MGESRLELVGIVGRRGGIKIHAGAFESYRVGRRILAGACRSEGLPRFINSFPRFCLSFLSTIFLRAFPWFMPEFFAQIDVCFLTLYHLSVVNELLVF